MDCIGAIKIKDGIFIGDYLAAQVVNCNNLYQDLEFVVSNKVTHVINTSGRQIQNHWESIGVVYLSYDWLDNESQVSILSYIIDYTR